MSEPVPNPEPPHKGQPEMSDDVVSLLRYRIASGYYNLPQVIDRLARALLRGRFIER